MSISFSLWETDHRCQSCHAWPMVCWPLIVLHGRSVSSSRGISLCWWATQSTAFLRPSRATIILIFSVEFSWLSAAHAQISSRCQFQQTYFCQVHTRTGTNSSMASYSPPQELQWYLSFLLLFVFFFSYDIPSNTHPHISESLKYEKNIVLRVKEIEQLTFQRTNIICVKADYLHISPLPSTCTDWYLQGFPGFYSHPYLEFSFPLFHTFLKKHTCLYVFCCLSVYSFLFGRT